LAAVEATVGTLLGWLTRCAKAGDQVFTVGDAPSPFAGRKEEGLDILSLVGEFQWVNTGFGRSVRCREA